MRILLLLALLASPASATCSKTLTKEEKTTLTGIMNSMGWRRAVPATVINKTATTQCVEDKIRAFLKLRGFTLEPIYITEKVVRDFGVHKKRGWQSHRYGIWIGNPK